MRSSLLGLTLGAVVGAFGLSGCGDDAPDAPAMTFSMQAHALECDLQGIGAWLIIDALGMCELEVSASDRTVSGQCRGVPTGEVVEMTLRYWFVFEGERLTLANATVRVDLRGESREVVPVDFGVTQLSYVDDDQDGLNNLEELCMGRNPQVPGS